MILEEINGAKDSMNAIRGDINRASSLYNQIALLKREKSDLVNTSRIKIFAMHFFPALFIISFIFTIVMMILSPILSLLGVVGDLIYRLAELIIMILIFVLPIFFTVKFELSPYYIHKMKKIDERLEPAQKEADSLSQKIEEHFRTDERLRIIPDKYMYPQAVDYFHEVISLGRASDLKEAMNLYEDYLHKWRMEEGNQRMLRLQQATLEEAQAAKMASRTAAALSMAAFMSRD